MANKRLKDGKWIIQRIAALNTSLVSGCFLQMLLYVGQQQGGTQQLSAEFMMGMTEFYVLE